MQTTVNKKSTSPKSPVVTKPFQSRLTQQQYDWLQYYKKNIMRIYPEKYGYFANRNLSFEQIQENYEFLKACEECKLPKHLVMPFFVAVTGPTRFEYLTKKLQIINGVWDSSLLYAISARDEKVRYGLSKRWELDWEGYSDLEIKEIAGFCARVKKFLQTKKD